MARTPGLFDDVVSNDAVNVFTANNDSANVAGATLYKVYPHWTIGTVFGPQNQTGLLGGNDIGRSGQRERV